MAGVALTHQDLVGLIRGGVLQPGGVWAELGSGEGAFTAALAELLGPGSVIHSVDRDGRALERQVRWVAERYPDVEVLPIHADFTGHLDLPPLDGILMANSLHFVRRKDALVKALGGRLKPASPLIMVEYNSDRGNPWVPYPLSYAAWERLAQSAGFVETRRIGGVPSRFLREIYSAVSLAPPAG